jgi:hypothetical protein
MLTKKGFETYFIPQSDSISELALVDRHRKHQRNDKTFGEKTMNTTTVTGVCGPCFLIAFYKEWLRQ